MIKALETPEEKRARRLAKKVMHFLMCLFENIESVDDKTFILHSTVLGAHSICLFIAFLV